MIGADLLLLTKNQVLMIFRMAAIYGEDLDFVARLVTEDELSRLQGACESVPDAQGEYLEEDFVELYGTEQAWTDMVLRVVEQLEEKLGVGR